MLNARPVVLDQATADAYTVALRLLRSAAVSDTPDLAALLAIADVDDPERLRQIIAALAHVAAHLLPAGLVDGREVWSVLNAVGAAVARRGPIG